MPTVKKTDEIMKELADEFSSVLKGWLTPGQWTEMQAKGLLNEGTMVCASHDYCDANMAMDAAFVKVLKRHPELDDDDDVELWNKSWSDARRRHLVAGVEAGIINGH